MPDNAQGSSNGAAEEAAGSAKAVQSLSQSLDKMQMEDVKKNLFWATQPMPALNEDIPEGVNEAMEPDRAPEDIRQEPYNLPPGFMWETMDLLDEAKLDDLYTLLNENYVEDDDNLFRFNYSRPFLRWALMPPGWRRDWHVAVRVAKTARLFGFISAVPATVRVHGKVKQMVEINFLCVHKKLRAKRLAPVLIKEVTRRVNATGLFQAAYTAGVVLPHPTASCSYFHRSLNPKKLIQVRFSYLSANMTLQRTMRLYSLPEAPNTPGFRRLQEADLAQCQAGLEKYLARYKLCPEFTVEEFAHWFLPRAGVVDAYVVARDGVVTDFVSYYHLDSTVVNHATYKDVRAAYLFYYFSTATPLKQLMKDALISAKNSGCDVFNALNLMENQSFFQDLKFAQGDGDLQYYLYNWRCTNIQASDVALVLQ